MEESNDFDPKLEALFKREHTHLSAEPFLGNTLARVAVERGRVVVVRRVLQVLGVLAVVIAAPWLIRASVLMSLGMEAVFAQVSTWLANPVTMGIVALLLAVGFVFARRWRARLAELF